MNKPNGLYYTVGEAIVYTDRIVDEYKAITTANGKELVGDVMLYDVMSTNQSGFDVDFCRNALVYNPKGRKGKWGRTDGLYARNDGVTPSFKIIYPNGDETFWDLKSCVILSKRACLALTDVDKKRITETYKSMGELKF
jgi:hypothetical protein